MKPSLKFHNPYHNGDIHLSRGLIKHLKHFFTVTFSHNCSSRLTDDLCETIREPINPRRPTLEGDGGGTILVNTWFCQPENKGRNEIHLLNLWKTFQNTPLGKFLKHPTNLIPPSYPGSSLHLSKPSVLLCTNKVESLQCSNVSKKEIYQSIVDLYSFEVDFYVTNKDCFDYGHMKNVIFVDDLYPLSSGKNDQTQKTNLPEISKLSESCQIIVGGGSGPYEVTKVDTNLLDSEKVFVCHSTRQFDVLWADPFVSARGYWTRDDPYYLYEVLNSNIQKMLARM